jgi:hypothetical protein
MSYWLYSQGPPVYIFEGKNYINHWRMYHWQHDKLRSVCMIKLLISLNIINHFLDSQPRSIGRIKWTTFVASMIVQSYICWYLPMGPSERHSLLERSHMRHELCCLIQGAHTTTIQHMPGMYQYTRNSFCHRAQPYIQTNSESPAEVLIIHMHRLRLFCRISRMLKYCHI